MNDLDIHQICMNAVDGYTGLQGNSQPRYATYPYPQRLSLLSANLKAHILREAGDLNQYLNLHEEITAMGYTGDKPLYEMMNWLHDEITDIKPATPENNIVISLLVFGESYTTKFLNFTVPSLLAPGNLPALIKEKSVIFYIQTDFISHEQIEQSAIIKAVKALGVHIVYVMIPADIMKTLDNQDIIYWLLGASATLGIHYAKSIQAAFHHSYPDVVYSDKFFSEMLRLSRTHQAILGTGMRSDEAMMIPALETYRTAASDAVGYPYLAIPASHLLAHHLNCLHPVAWGYVVNNRPNYWTFPASHVMLWEAEDSLQFNCPHLNALWLEYSVIKDLPARYYQTLDSELDLICKGEDYYIPQEVDEVYIAELSPADKAPMVDAYADPSNAARHLWQVVTHRDSMKFFFRGMRLKIDRQIRPNHISIIPSVQVRIQSAYLYNTIMMNDPYAQVQLNRAVTHRNYIFS